METTPRLSLISSVFVFAHINNLHGAVCPKYSTISDVRRSAANNVANQTNGIKLICDKDFIKDGTWYRFNSSGGTQMTTANPGLFHCGTYSPIWLAGSHPNETGRTVDRKACVNIPFQLPEGCGISYNIKVINCGGFYLYQLKEPQGCSLGYCTGSKTPQECDSTTGESNPDCPGSKIPKPCNSTTRVNRTGCPGESGLASVEAKIEDSSEDKSIYITQLSTKN